MTSKATHFTEGDALLDISSVTPPQGAFTLSRNFVKNCQWLQAVPHEKAAQVEASKLGLLFQAWSEYIQEPSHAKKLTKKKSTKKKRANIQRGQNKIQVSPQDLKKAFIKLARESGSLVLSDMPITSVKDLEIQAEQSGSSFWYSGNRSSFFPDKEDIRGYRGWVFMQKYRSDTKTRITLPLLGLSDKYAVDDVLAGDGSIITHMQNIGRMSNHDWLHHMTMTVVNDSVVYTDILDSILESDISYVSSRIPGLSSWSINKYEAFCVKTHVNLLQTDSAKPLWNNLVQEVEALTEDLSRLFQVANTVRIDKMGQYKALNYLALTTARILRRAESVDSPLTQNFLKSVVNMSSHSNAAAKEAYKRVWHVKSPPSHNDATSVTSELRRQYDRSGLFIEIYEDNEFSAKTQELARDLAKACRDFVVR